MNAKITFTAPELSKFISDNIQKLKGVKKIQSITFKSVIEHEEPFFDAVEVVVEISDN